jgi:hypothetical protein
MRASCLRRILLQLPRSKFLKTKGHLRAGFAFLMEMGAGEEQAMTSQQKKDPSQTPAQDHGEHQQVTQIRPSHMNQGNQTFRPDKQKRLDESKQSKEDSPKAS